MPARTRPRRHPRRTALSSAPGWGASARSAPPASAPGGVRPGCARRDARRGWRELGRAWLRQPRRAVGGFPPDAPPLRPAGVRSARAALELATLALAEAAPDPEALVVLQSVFEALGPDLARCADPLGIP